MKLHGFWTNNGGSTGFQAESNSICIRIHCKHKNKKGHKSKNGLRQKNGLLEHTNLNEESKDKCVEIRHSRKLRKITTKTIEKTFKEHSQGEFHLIFKSDFYIRVWLSFYKEHATVLKRKRQLSSA